MTHPKGSSLSWVRGWHISISHRCFYILASEQFLHDANIIAGFQFYNAHFGELAFVVKEDIAPGPVDINLLGTVGIMLQPDGIAKLVKRLLDLGG